MRKLASIQRIAEVRDIEGADAIQAYRVLGWWVVDKKNAYKVGDTVVYCEPDSWVPHELAPFLSKGREPREYNSVKGERLRTVLLRGQVSQGLLLPVEWHGDRDKFPCVLAFKHEDGIGFHRQVSLDDDVTDALNIQKWEPEIPAQLQGQAAGVFPTSLIPKTDQTRIQTCFDEIQAKDNATYEVSMKLDGTSCTIFRWKGELRVCGRNYEFKINEENKDNTLVKLALALGDLIPDGIALQGEIWGESIQGNKEGIRGQRFSVFDMFDIKKHEYIPPVRRRHFCETLGIDHVPVLGTAWKAPASVEEGLAIADGPSIHAKLREGIVYKCNEDPSFSFKIISNEWLVRHKE